MAEWACLCACRPDGSVQATHHVLNECLIDRGPSPSMIKTELFVDGHHITTVQASRRQAVILAYLHLASHSAHACHAQILSGGSLNERGHDHLPAPAVV